MKTQSILKSLLICQLIILMCLFDIKCNSENSPNVGNNCNSGNGKNDSEKLPFFENPTVYPQIVSQKSFKVKQKILNSNTCYDDSVEMRIIQVGDWLLELYINSDIGFGVDFVTEWVESSGKKKSNRSRARSERNQLQMPDCEFTSGNIHGDLKSDVYVTLCEGVSESSSTQTYLQVTGFIHTRNEFYFIEPVRASTKWPQSDTNDNLFPHTVFKVNQTEIENTYKSERKNIFETKRPKRHSSDDPYKKAELFDDQFKFSYNLTGDTIDIGESFSTDAHDIELDENETGDDKKDINKSEKEGCEFNIECGRNESAETRTGDGSVKWRREDLDTERIGYFLDPVWIVQNSRKTNSYNGVSPTLWLKIAIAADHSVVEFHGRARVRQYIVSLMNIVSAIYKDASLNANMKLVITRFIIYTDEKDSQVQEGDAKISLENVNRWNKKFTQSLPRNEQRHDIAIWLTKLDIGGPSGYAPVSGTCDEARSCALNRDEGLTSAFIIAHEMAHILGLSHDGDKKSGNDCDIDATGGSVMAAMVSATFHSFRWSQCSQNEFHKKIKDWSCLTKPPRVANATQLDARVSTSFTMDEQCRMEFGEGYGLCRGLDVVEPCSHLWCGNLKSPLVCKTKKGPPLEKTECGPNKWCEKGYCVLVDKRRFNHDRPIHMNPLNGGWGKWSSWGSCSKSCDVGVSFRTRQCDNPSPAYGGLECFGRSEEFRVCNLRKCQEPVRDPRALQCAKLQSLVSLGDSSRVNLTWLPHEAETEKLKCQLTCVSKESGEVFLSGENLIDGTPCSYERPNGICIQGDCHKIGCDGQLMSDLKEDSCGVCNGDNSECRVMASSFQKTLRREMSRVVILPKHARHILIRADIMHTTVHPYGDKLADPLITIALRNRKKRTYSLVTSVTNVFNIDRTKSMARADVDVTDETMTNTTYTVVEGARFHYRHNANQFSLGARGPLLEEIVATIRVPKRILQTGVLLSVSYEYRLHRDIFDMASRFHWIVGGWGPCSVSCGGGRRYRTIACRDTHTKRIVPRRKCSLVARPSMYSESCNNISCDFVWVAGEWEFCTKTCGSRGIQSRELYCVPKSIAALGEINSDAWKYAIRPDRCSEAGKPDSMRYCNRYPCPVYWVHGKWSRCSVTCGLGYSTREVYCPGMINETFYSCGPAPPVQRRACKGPFNRRNNPKCHKRKRMKCEKDESQYCQLTDLLSKYCIIPGFRKMCCISCISNMLPG